MRGVYLDLGANVGGTIRAFMQEHPSYACYAFEPNKALLPMIADVGLDLGRDINVIWGAAWVHDGAIDLFGSGRAAASTIIHGKQEYEDLGWPAIDYSQPSRVPAIDLSRWLVQNFTRDDHVVVKMDIEGAEYKVLRKLLDDGSISLISRLRCEWHHDRFPEITEQEHDELRAEVARHVPVEDWV
jgi:FkbM family methyltransferase